MKIQYSYEIFDKSLLIEYLNEYKNDECFPFTNCIKKYLERSCESCLLPSQGFHKKRRLPVKWRGECDVIIFTKFWSIFSCEISIIIDIGSPLFLELINLFLQIKKIYNGNTTTKEFKWYYFYGYSLRKAPPEHKKNIDRLGEKYKIKEPAIFVGEQQDLILKANYFQT